MVERVRALSKKARGGSDADFARADQASSSRCRSTRRCRSRARSHTFSTWPTSPSSTIASGAAATISATTRRRRRSDRATRRSAGSIAAGISPDRLHEAISAAAHRAGVHRAPHRGHAPHADAEVQAHRRSARRARSRRPHAARARRAASTRCASRSPRRGKPAKSGRGVPRRSTKRGRALAVFEQALWDAVPQFLRSLNAALVKHTGRGLPPDRSPLCFGSWIGGDRDGNPAVTAQVTGTVVPPGALAGREPLPARGGCPAAGALDERRQRRS